VDVQVWLAVVLASLVPVHITRGPVVTQATGGTAHVAFLTDRAVAPTVRIDGHDFTGPAGTSHRIVVSGLSPGQRYPYDILAGSRRLGGGSLRTDPGPDGSFRAAVFGDYGEGTTAETGVIRLAAGWRPDVLVSTGDNVYLFAAGGFLLDPNMFGPLLPLLQQVVFVPALGNHDTFLDDGKTLLAALDLPGAERYYVQRYGPVAFIVLDSDSPLGPGSPQLAFLKTALKQTQDSCFRVAVFHHPPFSAHSGNIAPVLRRNVVPLLQAGRVQLTLLGHVHDYERSYDRKGVTYVVVGTGGAAIGRYPLASIPLAYHLVGTYGAVQLNVAPHLIKGAFEDVHGHVRDRFQVGC
jgi:hypothetical protein